MRATSFVDWNDMKQIISLWCQQMLEIWSINVLIKSHQPSFSILHSSECSSVKSLEKKWCRKHWTWFLSSGFTVPVRMKIYREKDHMVSIISIGFTITGWDIYGHRSIPGKYIHFGKKIRLNHFMFYSNTFIYIVVSLGQFSLIYQKVWMVN